MNFLYTPGPWVCLDGKVFSDGFTTETPIATVHKRKSPHVTIANARLVACSPELLEALNWLLNDPHTERGGHTAITYANSVLSKAI